MLEQGMLQQTKVAPRIQGLANKLERQINTNSVQHLLESRPNIKQLFSDGILRNKDSKIAPRIQGVASKLEKRMVGDVVGHLLETRPNEEFITQSGIKKSNR